jgi:hypothetical protein
MKPPDSSALIRFHTRYKMTEQVYLDDSLVLETEE